MTGFYGGPNGTSFHISHVFNTRFGPGDSMENDLSQGWTSPFPIGSYVAISYGLPSDEAFKDLDESDKKYKEYYDQDAKLGLKTYNSTLWKKVYNEHDETYNGISYELIASMTGATPRIEFVRPVDVLDPVEMPDIRMANDSTVDKPKVVFRLPRAVKFYYGNFLGKRQDKIYTLSDSSFKEYGVGDYYINAPTGFIYLITKVQGTQVTFEYVACIQSPLPKVRATGISPYKDDGSLNDPTVVRNLTNDEGTAWELVFGLPKAPTPDVNATFVGSLDEGGAQVEVTDKDTMTFNFQIPSGSRMFAGDLVDAGKYDTYVEGAKPGDLYLNTKNGTIYILQKGGIWEVQQGSLRGPAGEALHVVRNYPLAGDTLTQDTLEAGRDYIIEHYRDEDNNPLPYKTDEIFAVTFTDTTQNNKETSYWYFYTEDKTWGRVQLTSGVMSFLENTYVESPAEAPVTNKTYSIDYINKLIGNNIDINPDKTAYSKDQIYEMISWGSFEDAATGSEIPVPENHDTLSAEEVIKLLSWTNIY